MNNASGNGIRTDNDINTDNAASASDMVKISEVRVHRLCSLAPFQPPLLICAPLLRAPYASKHVRCIDVDLSTFEEDTPEATDIARCLSA